MTIVAIGAGILQPTQFGLTLGGTHATIHVVSLHAHQPLAILAAEAGIVGITAGVEGFLDGFADLDILTEGHCTVHRLRVNLAEQFVVVAAALAESVDTADELGHIVGIHFLLCGCIEAGEGHLNLRVHITRLHVEDKHLVVG